MDKAWLEGVRLIETIRDGTGAESEAFLRGFTWPRIYLGIGTLFRGASERARGAIWREEGADLARLMVGQPWELPRSGHLRIGDREAVEGRWLSPSVGVVLVLVSDLRDAPTDPGELLSLAGRPRGTYDVIDARATARL